jgi:hypothetical protein
MTIVFVWCQSEPVEDPVSNSKLTTPHSKLILSP